MNHRPLGSQPASVPGTTGPKSEAAEYAVPFCCAAVMQPGVKSSPACESTGASGVAAE